MGRELRVAVVGAKGLVGSAMLALLEERKFPVGSIVALGSSRSAGSEIRFRGERIRVAEASADAFKGVDVALFSAGSEPSRRLAPEAAAHGAIVIDNSSAWRMDPDVPLCVPEVNIDAALAPKKRIIANPNCSTIQLTVALAPIHRVAPLTRVIVSTYQAVSGAGARAVESLRAQFVADARGETPERGELPGILSGNLLMGWKPDRETGYSEEELKIIQETRKILGAPNLRVSPTTVRVPVANAHSESVFIEASRPIDAREVRSILERAKGVVLEDDFANGVYPAPRTVSGRDEVFVGRIRDDLGTPGAVLLWVVADNLRKGAALNAIQIAERLFVSTSTAPDADTSGR